MSKIRTVTARRLEPMLAIVDLARRAPSVHNTQPWRWLVGEQVLELWSDPSRHLTLSDPDGRTLTISCGAALHHAVVGAQALGWRTTVDHCPDPFQPDLLARIQLTPGPPKHDAAEVLAAIDHRCTDRRRFTAWPVPADRLEQLADWGRAWGASVESVTDRVRRHQVELLISRAARIHDGAPAVVTEEQAWLDRPSPEGIPPGALALGSDGYQASYPSRFDPTPHLDGRHVESSDGLLVVGTEYDGPLSWLHAGAALSALWLPAARSGLSVVPLSQVTEIEETRIALRHQILEERFEPQLLVRIGWQEIGRSNLVRTPRRPLEQIVDELP